MKSKWTGLARILALLLMIVLFINSFELFKDIRRQVIYGSRSTGLSTLDEWFGQGEYQKIWNAAVVNTWADDELSADVSQYEAFGRYYHAWVKARSLEDNEAYLETMEKEKAAISWKKIREVIKTLEEDLRTDRR